MEVKIETYEFDKSRDLVKFYFFDERGKKQFASVKMWYLKKRFGIYLDDLKKMKYVRVMRTYINSKSDVVRAWQVTDIK